MISGTASTETTAANSFLKKAAGGQAYLVFNAANAADPAWAAMASYSHIAEALHDHGLEIVHERIFGSLSAERAVMVARARSLHERGIQADGPTSEKHTSQ